MTGEIDTAAYRAAYVHGRNPTHAKPIAALCDALDEALEDAQESTTMMRRMRAQRDEARDSLGCEQMQRRANLEQVAELKAELVIYQEVAQEVQRELDEKNWALARQEAALARVRALFGLDCSETCGKLPVEERDPDCMECLVANALDGETP